MPSRVPPRPARKTTAGASSPTASGMPAGLAPDRQLAWAVRQGNAPDTVRSALRAGARVNGATLINGHPTWLSWAVRQASVSTSTVEALLAAGATTRWPQENGVLTALHVALAVGHVAKITLFLDRPDVDVRAQNHEGDTVLHLATYRGHTRAVHRLLRAGADPLARNHEGHTPIDTARLGGYPALALELEAPLLQAAVHEAHHEGMTVAVGMGPMGEGAAPRARHRL